MFRVDGEIMVVMNELERKRKKRKSLLRRVSSATTGRAKSQVKEERAEG